MLKTLHIITWPHVRMVAVVIAVVSSLSEAWLYEKRDALLSAYTPATEAQLYNTYPNISSISYNGGNHISICVSTKSAGVPIRCKAAISGVSADGQMSIKVVPGFNRIPLEIGSKQYNWNVTYTPEEVYAHAGNSNARLPGVICLMPSEIPLGKPIIKPSEWSPGRSNKGKTDGGASGGGNWHDVLVRAIRFLASHRGVPTARIENSGLTAVVKQLEVGSSRVWCTQFAMYAVSQLREEIPVRLVEIGGYWEGDSTLRTGGHTFVEFLDPHFNRWVLADPLNGIVSITGPDNEPLGAIELTRVMSLPGWAENFLTFEIVDQITGAVESQKFEDLPLRTRQDLRFYFRARNRLTYHTGISPIYTETLTSKARSWLSLNTRFALYAERPPVNVSMLRVGFALLSACSILACICGEVVWRSGRNVAS